jgi:gluconate kinase
VTARDPSTAPARQLRAVALRRPDAPPLVIATRLAGRSDPFMPLHLLASQSDTLEPPTGEPDVVCVHVNGPQPQVLHRVIAAPETT